MATGIACGKIILIGEHAVVYHQPAIAIPFSAVQVRAHIKQTDDSIITLNSSIYSGDLAHAPALLDGLRTAFEKACFHLAIQPTNMAITIDSTIPFERGMGSSASVTAAAIRALAQFTQKPLDDKTLKAFVDISENIAHGSSSGIDASVITYETPLYYVKNQPLHPFHYSLDAYLVVADSGITGNTKDAVSRVKHLQETQSELHQQLIEQLGQLTKDTQQALLQQNAIAVGKIFSQAHHCLQQLTVSTPLLDTLVDTALQTGALGAKLTGGGLGGCMIALASSKQQAEQIANNLKQAGAVNTYIQHLL